MSNVRCHENMIDEQIREWLLKTGFPLEMEVASAFRKGGFDVRQSATYPDPQEGKSREIDVLANDQDLWGIIEIAFVVECKSSSKPWIVLTSPDARERHNLRAEFSICSEDARDSLARRPEEFPNVWKYVDKPAKTGYGFRQAFGAESDQAYAAAVNVVKACQGITRSRHVGGLPRLAFAFPVIVVKAPLFECSLSSKGEIELVEVQSSEFLFSAHIPHKVGCSIAVVRHDAVPAFVASSKLMTAALRSDLELEEERLLAKGRTQ